MDLARCLELVAELAGAEGADAPCEPTAAETDALLDFARSVAHATERKSAPLAAYAIGVALASVGPGRRAALISRAAEQIDELAAAES